LVRRLRPDWRDSEGFYELRSEVTGGLTALGRRLGYAPPPVASGITTLTPTPTKPRLVNGFARRCPTCNQPFFTPTASRLTCSNACRQEAYRRRRVANGLSRRTKGVRARV
jgi:hypothetical protein